MYGRYYAKFQFFKNIQQFWTIFNNFGRHLVPLYMTHPIQKHMTETKKKDKRLRQKRSYTRSVPLLWRLTEIYSDRNARPSMNVLRWFISRINFRYDVASIKDAPVNVRRFLTRAPAPRVTGDELRFTFLTVSYYNQIMSVVYNVFLKKFLSCIFVD